MKTKNYGISKREEELIEKLEINRISLFTIKQVKLLLKIKPTQAYDLIKNLAKKGFVKKIKSGKYFIEYRLKSPDLFEIACQITWPCYLSFWAVLQRYGFTEQVPYILTVVTTKSKQPIKLSDVNIKFVKFKPKRFFGYTASNNIVIATKEKAIIDSLYLPKYSGGIAEINKCLNNAWGELDKYKLIKYAIKMESKALLQRLGHLIEESKLPIKKSLINKLRSNISSNFIKLDPDKSLKGIKCVRWNVIRNEKNIFEWRTIR